jgi:hypothetical protein
MDEVFGGKCCGRHSRENAGQSSELIAGTADFVLWFESNGLR